MTDNFASASIPRKVSKLKEKAYANVSYMWFIVAFVWLVGSCVILLPMLIFSMGLIGKCILVAVLFVWLSIGFVWFRDTHKMEATFMLLNFFNKSISGKNNITKYTLSADRLKEIIPIEEVHPEGLIEFVDNHYGVLLNIDAPRVTDDELLIHEKKIAKLIDSLYGDQRITTYTASKLTTSDGLKNDLVDKMNIPDVSDAKRKHLHSIYDHIEEKKQDHNEWMTWFYIYMGQFDSVEDAEKRRQTYIPGLIKGHMQKADILCTVVQGDDVILSYRQMIEPRNIMENSYTGWD